MAVPSILAAAMAELETLQREEAERREKRLTRSGDPAEPNALRAEEE